MASANLATSAQENRTLVALLTKTIAEFTTQVTSITAKLLTAQSENARLNKSGHCLTNRCAPDDRTLTRDQNIYAEIGQKFDPNWYCSSHGFRVEETYTSATRLYLLDGNNKLATRMDTKGRKTEQGLDQWRTKRVRRGRD